MQQVRGRVIPDAFFAEVCQAALGRFRTRLRAMLFKSRVEIFRVDLNTLFRRQFLREFDRKAVCIVEPEAELSRQQSRALALQPLDLVLKKTAALTERLMKALALERQLIPNAG